jgi:hypothetical protein
VGKSQFAQKVEPELGEQLNHLISKYSDEGRIKEKGELLSLLYRDHLILEQKRNTRNLINDAELLDGHLKRIEEIFIESAKGFRSQLDIINESHGAEIKLLQQKIAEDKKTIEVLKMQLNEKSIKVYEINKVVEKLEKKVTSLAQHKDKTLG